MKNLIQRNKNLIIFSEFDPKLIHKAGCLPEEFIDELEQYGFQLHIINEENKCIKPVSKCDLFKMCKYGQYVNLYLKRN